ncbi:unnamed protein product, partial [Strongylus vulgaris]
VLDIPLLTSANTPASTTPGPSTLLPALPVAYYAASPALPVHATPVADQSPVVMSFSDHARGLGLGEVRAITSSVVLNNLVFFATTMFVGCVRVDGPLAPSKLEAERSAIVFASNCFNIPLC